MSSRNIPFNGKKSEDGSDEPFEPVLLYLADRTYPGGLFPCTEIPADLAPPDRVGQG